MRKVLHNKPGFTLLELMITVVIIGILGSTVTFSIRRFVTEKRSEQVVVGLWQEVTGLRARAIKDNVTYFMRFNTLANTYKVYKDADGDNALIVSNDTEVNTGFNIGYDSLSFTTVGTNVTGLPQVSNSGTATNLNLSSAIQGDWDQTSFGLITFSPNEIGTITSGAIFLKNTIVDNSGYVITRPNRVNMIKLYKWSGSKWYEM